MPVAPSQTIIPHRFASSTQQEIEKLLERERERERERDRERERERERQRERERERAHADLFKSQCL